MSEVELFSWMPACITSDPAENACKFFRVCAEKGFVEVRSDDYHGSEQARVDPLRLRVDFTAEPYSEPNDTPALATVLAPGEEIEFRLMPRLDRDVFAVTAPGDGALLAYILETGGHPDVRVRWLNAAGGELRPSWENSLTTSIFPRAILGMV